jgi:hypothetical protein
MISPSTDPEGLPKRPPPRTHGTPSGYRNVRVLVTKSLHYQISAFAGMSHTSLPEFVGRWLYLATPLDPLTGQPIPANNLVGAPSPGQGLEALTNPHSVPSASPMGKEAAPGPTSNPGPSIGPQAADRPGAAHPPGASASSTPDPGSDTCLIGSSSTASLDQSSSGHNPDQPEAD